MSNNDAIDPSQGAADANQQTTTPAAGRAQWVKPAFERIPLSSAASAPAKGPSLPDGGNGYS